MKALELKFRVDDLTPEGRPFAGALDKDMVKSCIEGLVGTLGYTPVSSAQAEGTVYRTESNEVIVSGSLKLDVAFQCVRCLKDLETQISSRNDYVFVRKASVQQLGEEMMITEDDDGSDALTFDGDEIDLEDIFRQELMLALPMNPSCDHSQNVECDGKASLGPTEAGSEMDPRWAPLLELKKKLQSGQ